MDRILTQILDACRQAQDLDRALRLSAVPLDPRYLLASCEDLAAAFQQAAAALRAGMLLLESPPETEQVAAQAGVGPSLLYPLRRELPPERRPSTKRKEGAVTKTVPAARIGDVDVHPDDGYTWRKYGQKIIHNSRFPRSYYRCTHKSFYGCGAKKQVQRLDDDPSTFKVTYRGEHTCRTSTTPLLIPAITVAASSGGGNRGPGDGEGPSAQLQLQAMAGSSSSQPQFESWLGGGEGPSAQLQLQATAGTSSSEPQFRSWLGGENIGRGGGEDPSAQLQLQSMAGPSSLQPQYQSWLGGGEGPSVQLQLQATAPTSSSQLQFQSWLAGENICRGGREDPSAQLQLQSMAGPSSSQPQFQSLLAGGEAPSAPLQLQATAGTSSSQPQIQSGLGGVGSRQAAAAGQGGGRDLDGWVAELADSMFNNPASSGSSMDAIFTPKPGN